MDCAKSYAAGSVPLKRARGSKLLIRRTDMLLIGMTFAKIYTFHALPIFSLCSATSRVPSLACMVAQRRVSVTSSPLLEPLANDSSGSTDRTPNLAGVLSFAPKSHRLWRASRRSGVGPRAANRPTTHRAESSFLNET